MEERAGASLGTDEQELRKSWKSSARDVSELKQRALEFLTKVDSGLYHPYYFEDAKRDFEHLMVQFESVEKGLKPRTLRHFSKRDLTLSKEQQKKEREQKLNEIEQETSKFEKGIHEAARIILKDVRTEPAFDAKMNAFSAKT
eukprot:CAMPEP_0184738434 /NCGR_PEP_ID=MMETSP0315-20130426/1071_1 /TAXON_ID=101924 /ORGANISM="Rhodosorus marinus, Strain UTEX LB 2760" /LENGTH=142 /DNA_ID=CAMNT_0027206125 /DNA_START=43 /DNA_END=471 /DNA_ORIENTATION=+